MTAVVVIEAVVILLLLVLVGGLLKSHAEILRQLHSLGASEDLIGPSTSRAISTTLGAAAVTQITGVDPDGGRVVVSVDHGRGNTLIAFLSSGCASCRVFWTEFAGEFELPDPTTRPLIVTKGADSESPSKISDLAPAAVKVVMSTEMWDTFRVPLTPYFLYVSGTGDVIGEGSATTWTHLLSLLKQSEADSIDPSALDTTQRVDLANKRLSASGIDPDDPSLYENPLDL